MTSKSYWLKSNVCTHSFCRLRRSCFWRQARDLEDERHVHPLQLDVIERACVMWSNPGETVLTPFMGVGSEVCGAIMNGRRGIGIELKQSYYRQAIKNLEREDSVEKKPEESLLAFSDEIDVD